EVTAGYAQRTETTAFDLAWPGFGPQRPSGAVGRALDAALDTLEAGTTHEVLVPLDITASAVPAEPARTWIPLLSEDDGQNGVFVTALFPSGPLADQVVSIDPASVVRDVDFALDPDTEALVDALGAYVETGVSRRGHVVPYLVRFVREQVLGEDVLGEDVLGEDVW
ncbi:MAG TPA: hypothetical protein RMH99_21930, partial [Sandaracinaceae bacterium LLY-WYZ-13_1]|nr:hypothetical protein [Sandaracinaceae bacterium LLY-WYZ-13_1]